MDIVNGSSPDPRHGIRRYVVNAVVSFNKHLSFHRAHYNRRSEHRMDLINHRPFYQCIPKALFLLFRRDNDHPRTGKLHDERRLIRDEERLLTTSKLRIKHPPENQEPQ